MNLTDVAQTRYSTKAFDPARKVPADTFAQLQSLLRFSPSSVNSQPWHFVLTGSEEGKQRIARAAQGTYAFNYDRIMNASHVVVFCAKTEISDAYLEHLADTEEQAGRFAEPANRQMAQAGRTFFVNQHRFDKKDAQHWMEKQVYLNIGSFLLGAGVLGLDALPMEGVDLAVLDEEFGLRARGYSAVAVVSVGYHSEQDFNKALPKARLSEEEIFTHI